MPDPKISPSTDPPDLGRSFQKWPFTQSELTAGLRRHTGDPRLTIVGINEREITRRLPAVGNLRGMEVRTDGATGKQFFHLVLKEPMGSTRAGSAGAGLREVNVYLTLKEHLPVRLPMMIAAHPRGEWQVQLHLPPGRRPDKWQAADYLLAVEQLVQLHDRFWGLGEDLSMYPWLAQPLKLERDIYIKAAIQDARDLSGNEESLLLAETDILSVTEQIIANIKPVTQALEESPFTLLHGDYWPGNILIHQKGGMTVFDWEDAGIGPSVLDLLGMIQGSAWAYSPLPLPVEEIVTHYRDQLAQAGAYTFSDQEFTRLWDHAVMWTFVTGWVGQLAKTPNALLPMRLEALQEVLFSPLVDAVERQFGQKGKGRK